MTAGDDEHGDMDVSSTVRAAGFAVLAAISSPDSLTAQAVTLPPSHAAMAGTGSTNVPFGRATATRAQFVYDSSLFGGAGAAALTFQTIDLRIDEGQTAVGKAVELELRASSLPRSVTAVQSQFAANRGVDETVVMARQIVQLAAAGGSATAPNPFDVSLTLDQPFTFDPSNSGALVLEFIVSGQAPGAFPLDTTFVCDSPTRNFGPPACGPAGRAVLGADSVTTQVTWGGSVTLRIFDADPSTLAIFALGFQESGPWSGLTLPVDLAVIGAPGCALTIAPVFSIAIAADVFGDAFFTFFLPSQLEIVGQEIKYQGIAVAPSANPLGVVTSRGFATEVCGWEATARVFSGGTSATSGLREIGVAPVVRLR